MEQQNVLNDILNKLKKDFGKEVGTIFGEDQPIERIPALSSGIISVDKALGIGGLPFGRIVELAGLEASGKSSLALNWVAEAQKQNLPIVYVDAENALDLERAKLLGVDLSKIIISQSETIEDAFGIAEQAIINGAKLVIIDSIAAILPKKELESDMDEETQVGLAARLIGRALRKLKGLLNQKGAILLLINQLREKVGTVAFGEKYTSPGGMSVRFYASVRLDLRNIGKVKQGDKVIGQNVKMKVAKLKVAPPFKEAEFFINFEHGIDKIGAIFDEAIKQKVIYPVKATFFYKDDSGQEIKLGVDRNPSLEALKNNNELLEQIKSKLI